MIRINLLPPHLRPVKRSPLPFLASVVILAVVILGMGAVWLNMQTKISRTRDRIAAAQSRLDALKATVDEYNQLQDQKTALAEKISIIQEIISDRMIWSRQLWNINRLTPDNFWYSRISEKEKPSKEMRMVFDEKTKKEQLKSVTVKHRVLELGGYVIKGVDGGNDIYPLTFNMEQDSEFSSVFQLSLPKLVDTEFNGYKVRSFTLEYTIRSGEEGT